MKQDLKITVVLEELNSFSKKSKIRPILLAGGGDGAFKTGLHHRSVSLESTTKILISIQRAVGMNVASFGAEDAFSDSEVTEILP